MRRKDREVTDYQKMLGILDACDCCRIGLVDGEEAYIVPLNFGYEEENGQITLYFHGAGEGRKIDLIRKQKLVTFEMDTKHELVEGTTACSYSYLYQSVMGKGRIELIQDHAEKAHGLDVVMSHYSKVGNWEYPEKMLDNMAVLKLTVEEWSCKEH